MSNTKIPIAALLMGLLAILSGCGTSTAGGTLGSLRSLAATCPKGKHVAGYSADDVSQNSRSDALSAERLPEIRGLATFTAVCGGSLQVVAFSASDAGTQTLYSGALQPSGATLNSRLLKVPAIVDGVMKAVNAGLPNALATMPGNATDVLAQFTLMSQFAEQLGPRYRLYGDVLTTGLQTTGAAITNVDLTEAAAVDLAKRVPMPSLPGAVVVVSGIGRVASGPPAPSGYVQALIDFYSAACGRTKAACTVTVNPFNQ